MFNTDVLAVPDGSISCRTFFVDFSLAGLIDRSMSSIDFKL